MRWAVFALSPIQEVTSDMKFTDCKDEVEGTPLNHDGQEITVKLWNVCDSAACAFIKCIPPHCGYSSCECCNQQGVYQGRMTFSEVDAEPQSDVKFDEMEDQPHHKGELSFRLLSIGKVNQFVLDYMRLICLALIG